MEGDVSRCGKHDVRTVRLERKRNGLRAHDVGERKEGERE